MEPVFGSILAMTLLLNSQTHKTPSEFAIPDGRLFGVGNGYSLILPEGVILPILLPAISVNQTLLSGPVVMKLGFLDGAGSCTP
jgi:hypothetical protein